MQAREERQFAEWLKELKAYRETYPYGVEGYPPRDEPNSSEKPNNCEYAENPSGDVWECGCFLDTYCEHQIYDRNPDGTINIVECGYEPKDEPTISKMEQVEDEPQKICFNCEYYEPKGYCNLDKCVVSPNGCCWSKKKHEKFYTFLWNIINPNEMQEYIEMFEPKNEPQTENE